MQTAYGEDDDQNEDGGQHLILDPLHGVVPPRHHSLVPVLVLGYREEKTID